MTTITYSQTLEVLTCSACGIPFAFPGHAVNAHRENRTTFYCPNGDRQWFPGETDEARRKKAEREAANALEEARIQAAKANKLQRELRTVKAQATRARKRAEAALCPVEGCGRSFIQLSRHLATKHPEYHSHEPAL